MLCPKCNDVSGERFCPQCGIDLLVYSELALFRSELETLRLMVLAGSQPSPEMTARLSDIKSGASQVGKTPPPLPPDLFKADKKKGPPRGGSPARAGGASGV